VLTTLVNIFQSANVQIRPRLLPVIRQLLQVLAEDRLTGMMQVECAIIYFPAEELTGWLQAFAQSEALHADALVRACNALRDSTTFDVMQLEALEAALASSPDERLRRLAFAALEAQSRKAEWDEARLARLQTYRADPSALVAAAATFTLPNEDDNEDDDDDDDYEDDWDDE
jgi:hypothetical protein